MKYCFHFQQTPAKPTPPPAKIKEEPKDIKPDLSKVKTEPTSGSLADEDEYRVTIDSYNSDLHVEVERDGLTASVTRGPGFEYMWAGGRASHGVSRGKVSILSVQFFLDQCCMFIIFQYLL